MMPGSCFLPFRWMQYRIASGAQAAFSLNVMLSATAEVEIKTAESSKIIFFIVPLKSLGGIMSLPFLLGSSVSRFSPIPRLGSECQINTRIIICVYVLSYRCSPMVSTSLPQYHSSLMSPPSKTDQNPYTTILVGGGLISLLG